MLLTLIIVLVCVGLGLAHRALARMRSSLPGLVVPALWVAAVVALFVRGDIDTPVDFVMALVGLGVLVKMWDEGRQERAAVMTAA